MNKVSKIVWLGWVANVVVVLYLWYIHISLPVDYSSLSYSERELVMILSYVRPTFSIAIVVQLLSVPLLFKLPRVAFPVAAISSLIMLPLGAIYFAGFQLSRERLNYHTLEVFRQGDRNNVTLPLHFKTDQFMILGSLLILASIFMLFISSIGQAGLLFGVGGLLFFRFFRLKNRIMVGLLQDKLIITPSDFSDTYLVPLTDITVTQKNKKRFTLNIKMAGVDRKCVFRTSSIVEQEHQTVLDELFSKLEINQDNS